MDSINFQATDNDPDVSPVLAAPANPYTVPDKLCQWCQITEDFTLDSEATAPVTMSKAKMSSPEESYWPGTLEALDLEKLKSALNALKMIAGRKRAQVSCEGKENKHYETDIKPVVLLKRTAVNMDRDEFVCKGGG
ncbi:hypothetical protein BTVI_76647 [Pitangus sulphuratus]|nr:hypothetical protein BTVI_76647 [Pitangus sulphuratus]